MSSSEKVGYGPPEECVYMGRMAIYHINMAVMCNKNSSAVDSDLSYHLELAKRYIENLNREGARFSAFVRSQPTSKKALATKICRQRKHLRQLQKLHARAVEENNLIKAVARRLSCEKCDGFIGLPYNIHTFCAACAKKTRADEQTTQSI